MSSRIAAGLFLLVFTVGAIAADSFVDARKIVDRLNASLIEVMKEAKKLGYQGRYRKLDPVVRESFEFEAVSVLALGTHWKTLEKEQKTAFMEKLTALSVATYAAQFNGYAGESFRYDSEQDLKNGRVLLRYFLNAPNEKPIKFEYQVHEFNGRWQIINIIVDGISDVALRKAQYTSLIDREGFDSLLKKLSQKISDYANNNATPS
jgi:phospholipid transport system substrate-binding protein